MPPSPRDPDDELPSIEIVSETADGRSFHWGDDGRPVEGPPDATTSNPPTPEPDVLTVEEVHGDTPMTRIVAAAEQAIERNRYDVVAGSGGHGSAVDNWLAERSSQVLQATPLPMTLVVDRLLALVGHPRTDLTLVGHRQTDERDVTFPARLRVSALGRRHVTVRVYPTPSANLTVLEMLPLRRWMPQTKRYLRAGVPAMTALIADISAGASGER